MRDFAYTEYVITTFDSGAEVWVETNDDQDTGYPGVHASWRLAFPSIDAALKHTGKSRRGFLHRVFVILDGQEI